VTAPSGGRHDHHVHLFAAAAALASAACGPPEVRDRAALARALGEAPVDARGWVRGVGYHESVAGLLDRSDLDALRPGVPVRVQHRSGQLWIVSSRGLRLLGLEGPPRPQPEPGLGEEASPLVARPEGIERDGAGRPTGRLYRCDPWLRGRLGPAPPPSLAAIGRRLAGLGITGVTDATPGNGPIELAAFAAAQSRGELPPRVVMMGTPELSGLSPPPGIEIGPVKLHLAEADLPRLEQVIDAIRSAHADGRCAALHCVTRTELVFALGAYAAAGVRPGDRLEHVHVAPPDCIDRIARLGLTVCTNPGLAAEREAAWRRTVESADRPWLWPLEALRRAGVPLLFGSDAPYGPLGDASAEAGCTTAPAAGRAELRAGFG
jgi:predicted amidohydrolase YtcJ